jgi:hypothetical protein
MTTKTDDTQEGFGEVPWMLTHINKAASLVSAHVHLHGGREGSWKGWRVS